jgi:C_GCAxxG_C_C family probable redox protein
MTRQEIEKYAYDSIASGLNCAESVLQTAITHCGIPTDGTPTRIASCFGGGVGRSKDELCGALAGGLMALGLYFGRDVPGASCELAYDLAAEFRERFIELHGSSKCRDLREGFGEQIEWAACKKLVADTTGILLDLIQENGTTRDATKTD